MSTGTLRRRAAAVLSVGLALACSAAWGAESPLDRTERLREDVRRMITHARDRVFPALVNIEVVKVNYWGGLEHKGGGVGSGAIMTPEGHVLTNYHVTSNGQRFRCRLADKREISARLIGEDPLTDLAVLQLDPNELEPGEQLPLATFGDSGELQVGDYVMAMGSPLALSRSVTLGIVSNTERVFGGRASSGEMELNTGERTGLFTRWIQHDAQIHPGNSGGPLVNLRGEIVGINELGGGAGQGFAIPSNLAQEVMHALIADGEVVRSWFGVSLRSLQDTGLETGVLVNSVVSDGPAQRAGIRAGDVLLEIAGEPVAVRFVEELPPLLRKLTSTPVGAAVPCVYARDGETHATEIVTEKMKKDLGDEDVFRAWGVTCAEITEKIARERKLDSAAGVLISGVRSGGPAQLAEPSLDPGDVVRAVGGEAVASFDGFVERYRRIMDQDELPEYLLIEFDRNGKNHVTLIKPKPDKDEDPPRELPKAWIGVATQPVLTNLAELIGLADVAGYRITRVYPRTEAAGTDLRVGDVIVKLNDEAVRPRGAQDAGLFSRAVRRLSIGDEARLTVLRAGDEREIVVPLERTKIEPSEARRDRNRDFDLNVRELTFFDRDENQWDEDVAGVLVESVESAGFAGEAGLRGGDLIQRINDYPIKGIVGYRKVMEIIGERQPERVVFVVLRGIQTSFLFVEPDWKPDADDESTPEQPAQNP